MTVGHWLGAILLIAGVYYVAKHTTWNLPVLG